MDPFLTAIATAAVGKATEQSVKGVIEAVRLVKRRFAREPERSELLLDAEEGAKSVEDVAAAVERDCAGDPEFLARLEELAGKKIQINTGTQVNQAGQTVKFQNNFYGGAPKHSVNAERIENLRLD